MRPYDGAQPTTRECTPEAREAAERMAALLMEEEEEDLAKAAGTPSQEGGRAVQAAAAAAAQSKANDIGTGMTKAGGGPHQQQCHHPCKISDARAPLHRV